jgi:hypothetical protein
MRSFFLLLSLLVLSCNQAEKKTAEMKQEGSKKEMKAQKVLRHVVLFNFTDSASEAEIKAIEAAFVGLPAKIPEIHDFEWGTNNSPEGLDKGLSHCFFVTFLSEEDRAIYLPHPAHQEFVSLVGPFVEDVTVVDYWVE